MRVYPFICDCCPTENKDLMLIETRFEGQRCFAELECGICKALWTAEIGPSPHGATPLADVAGHRQWRVLGIWPKQTH